MVIFLSISLPVRAAYTGVSLWSAPVPTCPVRLLATGTTDLDMQSAGWVDTTYLDEDFRIGRGDKGSVFVTARLGKAKELPPQPATAVAQR